MKTIAVLQADLETTPLGTRSRLAMELHGQTILRRTVERVRAVREVSTVVVLCPEAQFDRCAALLEGCAVELHRYDAAPPLWAHLVRSARKWSLDSWRGGIGGTTAFDEYTDPRLLAGVLQIISADAVLSVPPAAPRFDPRLAQRMIDHRRKMEEDVRLTFTTAPPGVAGILLDASLVRELAEESVPVGWLFSYQPDAPRKDMIFLDACVEIPPELRYSSGRLIADTERATGALSEQMREPQIGSAYFGIRDHSAAHEGRRYIQSQVDPLPREVEIELTTDDPYPDAVLRPRGKRVPGRGPIDVAAVRRVAHELAEFDDSLVVLGGFGEPLRHPRFGEILAVLQDAGAYGIAVCTAGVDLTDERIEALLDHGVDVLRVILDAWSPDLYGQLQSPHDPARASLEAVRRRMDRVEERKRARGLARPILVPELTKARNNVHEMEAFHDGWLRRLGASCITGFSSVDGSLPELSVINMAPPKRFPCRRIQSRCLILADGQVTSCDQDMQGRHVMGNLNTRGLQEIWHGTELEELRTMHRAERWSELELCAPCGDWHRP